MKIALIGFGGMGKVVHRIALERGHEVAVIVDPGAKEASHRVLENKILKGVDVVVDFSQGEGVMKNVRACLEAGVNLVMGTTGWYGKIEEVRKMILGSANVPDVGNDDGTITKKENQSAIGFLWSSNFSIGVNLYFKIVEAAASIINNLDEYDIWGHEIHHYNKADSPSGTAKTLEKILLENIKRKTSVVEDKLDRRREPHEIHFSSVRGGLVNFGHTIGFDSVADKILITHEARCRDGYALGAVKAAEWLMGKKGFFGMEDFMKTF